MSGAMSCKCVFLLILLDDLCLGYECAVFFFLGLLIGDNAVGKVDVPFTAEPTCFC